MAASTAVSRSPVHRAAVHTSVCMCMHESWSRFEVIVVGFLAMCAGMDENGSDDGTYRQANQNESSAARSR